MKCRGGFHGTAFWCSVSPPPYAYAFHSSICSPSIAALCIAVPFQIAFFHFVCVHSLRGCAPSRSIERPVFLVTIDLPHNCVGAGCFHISTSVSPFAICSSAAVFHHFCTFLIPQGEGNPSTGCCAFGHRCFNPPGRGQTHRMLGRDSKIISRAIGSCILARLRSFAKQNRAASP